MTNNMTGHASTDKAQALRSIQECSDTSVKAFYRLYECLNIANSEDEVKLSKK